MENNVILDKSKAFALRIINLYKYLCENKKEYILSKQILRSGTSIGANAKEAVNAQTKSDFYAKMYISYKEANETEYWLELLHESGYIETKAFESIYSDCKELIKILAAITKTQIIASNDNCTLLIANCIYGGVKVSTGSVSLGKRAAALQNRYKIRRFLKLNDNNNTVALAA